MMRYYTVLSVLCLIALGPCLASADETAIIDSIFADTLSAPFDSASAIADTLLSDSLADTTAVPPEPLVPMPPPVRLIDSLVHHFARHSHPFDTRDFDLYPRQGAGFLAHEASYFSMTYHETPLRTTVLPFGLPDGRINVQSGTITLHPRDRVIPPDGLTDFDDIPTADVVSAHIIEGPLSAYASLDGGLAMLYLEPFSIPQQVPKSEFTVERGAYGYAYTRARIGRMFGQNFGFTFSTDYRKGDGLNTTIDDDAYYVRARLMQKLGRRMTFDFYANVYRRQGGLPFQPFSGGFTFRRMRREQQYIASLTGQEVFGGQLTARFEYQASRAAFSALGSPIWRTIKPQFGEFEISYLKPFENALYRFAVAVGKDKYDIDQFYHSRDFGHVSISGLINRFGGRLFFYGRLRKAEMEDIGIEGAGGLARNIVGNLKATISAGFLTGWPTLTDRYSPGRVGTVGSGELAGLYHERGNPELESEKKLTANAALIFDNGQFHLSASLNAGLLEDVIYYNRHFDQYPAGEIYPDNDNIRYADLNLAASVDTLWWFYFYASATGRQVDSDRYGDRPPYSPRWQLYGQGGLRYYIAKYLVHLRLFGDVTYAERPLSYRLEELETGAVVTGGFNASLKDLTFYYMIHNFLDQGYYLPEGYGYTGWFYSWGFNWKFFD